MAFAAWLVPSLARAAPVELEWTAPAGCPDGAWVLGEIQRLTPATPPEPLRVRAVVRERGGEFHVDIELTGAAQGSRSLHTPTCASVARAAALIIALVVDPQAAAVLSDDIAAREEPRPAPPPLAAAPPPRPAVTPAPAAEADPPVRLRLLAGALLEPTLLPGPAIGAMLGAGVAWAWLRADLTVGFVPHASASLPETDAGADFRAGSLTLRGCGGPAWAAVALYGCASLRGSLVWAAGYGGSQSFDQSASVLSFDPGVIVRFPGTGRFAVELAGSMVVPVQRPRFVVVDVDGVTERELFRPAAVGGNGNLLVTYLL